ncbi:flagellar hook-length control protein FliK [Rahnella sp. FC061912-K]|uniref:flagellar hook-length control protein FliK n=1 Tax=Rahnella rivi TaxID=2816249 RepID=UPI001C27C54E|nr:flagellar hook-length control protein FliK [Rahnella rivi]MBU9830689.1 flagellar hook-length control protein FliK [Rahnella rivi]
MNLNILPAAVTSAKTTVSAASASTASDAVATGDVSTTGATADFASQLQAQLGEKLDPKLASQLSQLGQKISAKGQILDKATLTQAVTTGEEDGSLALDDSDLSKMIAAIQLLPNGSLKGTDPSAVKNIALTDKDKDTQADDATSLPVQALFAQLAAQQQPAQPLTTATAASAQSALSSDTADADKKSALLAGLTTTASSLLADDGKTAVTDSSAPATASTATAHATGKNTSAASPDFSSALAAMTAANGNVAVAAQTDSRTPDSALNLVNNAAVAVSSAPVSTTPTTTSAVTAPSTPLLNAQLGTPEWQQQLGQQVMMFNRQGQQTAELRLHPQDLGSIQISMKIENNQAQLHFVSGHSAVRSAIEAAMPDLKTALADNGISLGQSSVGSDSSQWQQAQQQSSQSGSQQGNASSWAAFNAGGVNAAADALPVPVSLAQRLGGNNSVDIFA